jgi:hypothetical protein
MRPAVIALLVASVACNEASKSPDLAVPSEMGVTADLRAPVDLGGLADLGLCCSVDFPCFHRSVCVGAAAQECHSQCFFGGPSPECSRICLGFDCCACCVGCICQLGMKTDCAPGTACMERGFPTEAACQPLDGGADLSGWTLVADGGHSC